MGSNCPWQFFPPAVLVYKILSPTNPSPVVDNNRVSMGPEISSRTGVWTQWRKAPKAFLDASSVPDKFPCPSFPCFIGENARKTTETTRILYPYRTSKIPGKKRGKRSKKKEFLEGAEIRSQKHINIKKRTGHPPIRTPPQNSLRGGPFSWKIKQKWPPT